MAKINVEKIKTEISKGTVYEQIDALQEIKKLVTDNVSAQKEEFEQKAADLETFINKD